MLDYLSGSLFVILFIWFLGMLGKRIHKGSLFSENLIYGFVIYTCMQFFGGFVVQLFCLPWLVYQIYMIVLLIILIGICCYKRKFNLKFKVILDHFQHYGVIYIIALIFVVLGCMNLQYLWNGNNIDDGFYLMKMRMSPYVKDFVNYNFAVGVDAPNSFIRAINTYELEGAFFSQLFGIQTSIYAKVFLSYVNYVLLFNAIYWCYRVLWKDAGRKIMIALIPFLFFGIYQEILANYGILYMQDSWQFNSAMWYGSTFVRTAGLFILIIPLLLANKINYKSFIFFTMTCIALTSKATQAIPLGIMVALVYISIYLFKNIKNKKFLMIGYSLVIAILIFIPINEIAQTNLNVINLQIINNFNLIIVKVSFFFIVISYLFGNSMLRRWNNWLLILALFMFIPRINTLFAYLSVYDFVAARLISLYLFTLIGTAFLDMFYIVNKVFKNKKVLHTIYIFTGIILVAVPLISIQRNLGLKTTLKVLKDNSNLIPESTLELGAKLEKFSTDRKVKLNMLMPLWVINDGTPHAAAAHVRYQAFNINSIGALARYNDITINSSFASYSQQDQDIWEKYHSGDDRNNDKLQALLKKYPVNCIVVYYSDVMEELIDKFDYIYVDKVMLSDKEHYYYILYKD